MGEYIGTTVTFGGKVKRSNLEALSEVMLDGGEGELETAQEEKRGAVTIGETNFGRAKSCAHSSKNSASATAAAAMPSTSTTANAKSSTRQPAKSTKYPPRKTATPT
jgi:hypothetical protein